jgi:hypothetical protein
MGMSNPSSTSPAVRSIHAAVLGCFPSFGEWARHTTVSVWWEHGQCILSSLVRENEELFFPFSLALGDPLRIDRSHQWGNFATLKAGCNSVVY